MRLSLAKTMMVVWLALALAVAAVFVLATVPREVAKADASYQLRGISSQTVQYGDPLNGSVDASGRLVGEYTTGEKFQVNPAGDIFIKASDIRVCRSASSNFDPTDLVALCGAGGRVCADVYAEAGEESIYYLTYTYQGEHKLFAPLQVYSVASGTPITGTFVDTAEGALRWTVEPRDVALAYEYDPDYGASTVGTGLPYAVEDDVLYLEHTYGTDAEAIRFAAAQGSNVAFDDQLTVSVAFEGNDATTHVGDYALDAFDIQVTRGGVSVMQNYHFTSSRATAGSTGYAMRVVPRGIDIASFDRDHTFTSKRVGYTQLYNGTSFESGLFSSQGFGETVTVAEVGQVITVYYDVVASDEQIAQGLWDVVGGEPREGVVAITEAPAKWTLGIVGWSVANIDPTSEYEPSAEDYSVAPAAGAQFTLGVQARAIVLYDSSNGGVPTDEREWVDVVAEHLAISLPYDADGNLYTSPSVVYNLVLDGTPIELSFDVQVLAEYFAQAEHEDSIRLEAATYDIINPSVDDTHYTVEVHGSVRWTVEPVAMGYADLDGRIEGAYSADSDGSGAAKDMAAYLAGLSTPLSTGICVQEYAYDGEATLHQFSFSFVDAKLGTTVTQKVSIGDGAAVLTPGYYAVAYADDTDDNYSIAAGVVYMRILPLAVTLVLPEGAIFSGEAHNASVRYGGSEVNPFAPADENSEGWTVALSYRAGNKAAQPIDKGVYTVVVTINGPAGSLGNPYLRYEGSGESFGVAAKAVTVTLRANATVSKTFGETVVAGKLTYTKTGFVGTDDVSLTSQGLEASAAPRAYPITATVSKGNAANYTITLLGADNSPNPSFVVNKVAAADAKSYFDSFVVGCVSSVANNAITLMPITYKNIAISGVSYSYAGADGEWHSTGETISGLKEGTLYHIRLVISAGGSYVDASETVFTEEIEAVTDIDAPILVQDLLATTSQSMVVTVSNYDRTKTYGCAVYPAGEGTPSNVVEKAIGSPDSAGVYTIARAYTLAEDEDDYGRSVIRLDTLADLQSGAEYVVVVVVKTTDKTVTSSPITVRTRAAAPTVAASALVVSEKSIDVPEGYYVYVAPLETTDALPVAAVVPVSMQQAGLTYAMLAESGAELTEEYLEEVTKGLAPNTTYVVAIWTEEDDLASAAQCFTFRTRVDNANRYSYTGFMLYFAQYLLVGLLGLGILCMLICAIRFAVLKKKLSGGNR